jgi:hypothetical protein
MNLEKRRLKHVLRHLGAAEIPAEVTEQLVLVPMDERLERGRVVLHAASTQQFLVGKAALPRRGDGQTVRPGTAAGVVQIHLWYARRRQKVRKSPKKDRLRV